MLNSLPLNLFLLVGAAMPKTSVLDLEGRVDWESLEGKGNLIPFKLHNLSTVQWVSSNLCQFKWCKFDEVKGMCRLEKKGIRIPVLRSEICLVSPWSAYLALFLPPPCQFSPCPAPAISLSALASAAGTGQTGSTATACSRIPKMATDRPCCTLPAAIL